MPCWPTPSAAGRNRCRAGRGGAGAGRNRGRRAARPDRRRQADPAGALRCRLAAAAGTGPAARADLPPGRRRHRPQPRPGRLRPAVPAHRGLGRGAAAHRRRLPHHARRPGAGAQRAGGALHRRPVPLLGRCHHPHRRRHGAGPQLRRARLLGQPQPGLPVAGHRRLPALPAGHPLPVRRGVCQRGAAARGARAAGRVLPALLRRRPRPGRIEPAVPVLRRAAVLRRPGRRGRVRGAQGQPGRAGRGRADALPPVHRPVRTRRRPLPGVRRGPGLQRFHRRPDRSGPAGDPAEEAQTLPARRRAAA